MTEVPSLVVFFGIPVVSEFDLRVFVAGGGEEDERESTLFVLVTLQFDESELVAIKVDRLVHVADAHHRMQILHRFIPVAEPN